MTAHLEKTGKEKRKKGGRLRRQMSRSCDRKWFFFSSHMMLSLLSVFFLSSFVSLIKKKEKSKKGEGSHELAEGKNLFYSESNTRYDGFGSLVSSSFEAFKGLERSQMRKDTS